MAKRSTHTELSSSEHNDEISSSEDQQNKSSKFATKTDSIKNYVSNVLARHVGGDEQPANIGQTHIKIDPTGGTYRGYENVSAFRQYYVNTEGSARTDAQRRQEPEITSDDDDDDDDYLLRDQAPTAQSPDLENSLAEFNMDPNPIIEERESGEQRYKQKVYLRQLQPPTPQPIEIQVQEILLQPQVQKPPIHVRVGHRAPRTPSPIVIKSAPPQPPQQPEGNEPIIYNKYVPPPKQPPQQIIIHHYPDLPPKPRPIVVEQWLPYKPAPKRIIKQSLPPEALQTPPPPHNLIVSYEKPRALIEVELIRLPIVKIDPYTYQQMSTGGQQQSAQHPTFQHEQDYRSEDRLAHASQSANQMNWRI